MSIKDKLKTKKYIRVCRYEFNQIRVIKPKFPITVTIYITRNRKNRGVEELIGLLIPLKWTES